MDNHFHVLLRVPQQEELADAELLRRYAVLYPKPTRYQSAQIDVIRDRLKSQPAEPEAVAWRERQLAMMGDVSGFVKLLKQRFSVWFNRTHQRFGTLWAERFKSVLVEGRGAALKTVAAYIDLNPVRAALVDDPKDYRFCGYGEAVAGCVPAQRGLNQALGVSSSHQCDWAAVQPVYRQILFGKATKLPTPTPFSSAKPSAAATSPATPANPALPLHSQPAAQRTAAAVQRQGGVL